MNWSLIAAGGVMLVAAGMHGVLGDSVLRRIGRLQLPPNAFGGPANTRIVLRVTWHFGTIAWAFLGAWLLAVGLQPRSVVAHGVTYLSATLLTCYGAIGVTMAIVRGGVAALVRHPGPLVLSTAAVLVWLGSTSL